MSKRKSSHRDRIRSRAVRAIKALYHNATPDNWRLELHGLSEDQANAWFDQNGAPGVNAWREHNGAQGLRFAAMHMAPEIEAVWSALGDGSPTWDGSLVTWDWEFIPAMVAMATWGTSGDWPELPTHDAMLAKGKEMFAEEEAKMNNVRAA